MSTDEQMSKQGQRHNNNIMNKDSTMRSGENHIISAELKKFSPYPLTNEVITEQSRAKRSVENANDQKQTNES